jgi:hypothetical protein
MCFFKLYSIFIHGEVFLVLYGAGSHRQDKGHIYKDLTWSGIKPINIRESIFLFDSHIFSLSYSRYAESITVLGRQHFSCYSYLFW